MSETINIGISACVLGERVRCNGKHARDSYLTETLAKYVKYIPFCPEVACGMNTPRERLLQIDTDGDIHLVASQSGEDWTSRMHATCERLLKKMEGDDLDGFILRRDSASCSLDEGKILSVNDDSSRLGEGFFTRELMKAFPLLPLELSQRLQNPIIKENFIRRVFVHRRWRAMLKQGRTMENLMDFHGRHKMLILANDARGFSQLEALLDDRTVFSDEEIVDTYGMMLFKAMAHNSTPRNYADVLLQAVDLLKSEMADADVADLKNMINAYKSGKAPLLIPVTVINHYARKMDKEGMVQQYFLNPDPAELKVLYHV